jgi:TRAP-type C4-dicarboxylate transport system permease large subunit
MVVLSAVVILPAIVAAEIDLLWFGIFIVLVVEILQITPPIGFNMYVLQGWTGKDVWSVSRSSLPFFLSVVSAFAIVRAVPAVLTWLPSQMFDIRKSED